jgi:hypothetical protein
LPLDHGEIVVLGKLLGRIALQVNPLAHPLAPC